MASQKKSMDPPRLMTSCKITHLMQTSCICNLGLEVSGKPKELELEIWLSNLFNSASAFLIMAEVINWQQEVTLALIHIQHDFSKKIQAHFLTGIFNESPFLDQTSLVLCCGRGYSKGLDLCNLSPTSLSQKGLVSLGLRLHIVAQLCAVAHPFIHRQL